MPVFRSKFPHASWTSSNTSQVNCGELRKTSVLLQDTDTLKCLHTVTLGLPSAWFQKFCSPFTVPTLLSPLTVHLLQTEPYSPVMITRALLCDNRASWMFKSLRCFSSSKNAQQHAANTVAYLLPTQTATEDVAALHSATRELKDVHLISGTLGAGKSTFW